MQKKLRRKEVKEIKKTRNNKVKIKIKKKLGEKEVKDIKKTKNNKLKI